MFLRLGIFPKKNYIQQNLLGKNRARDTMGTKIFSPVIAHQKHNAQSKGEKKHHALECCPTLSPSKTSMVRPNSLAISWGRRLCNESKERLRKRPGLVGYGTSSHEGYLLHNTQSYIEVSCVE